MPSWTEATASSRLKCRMNLGLSVEGAQDVAAFLLTIWSNSLWLATGHKEEERLGGRKRRRRDHSNVITAYHFNRRGTVGEDHSDLREARGS